MGVKVIIAGSRTIPTRQGSELVRLATCAAALLGWDITEVVCGEARGIDACGKRWAEARGIAVKSMAADWDRHGKQAGYLRNQEMAAYADALIAITNGSPGTAHMIRIARSRNMPVIVVEIP